MSLSSERFIEFPFSGETERVLGVSAAQAAETALMQAKTIKNYLSELRNLGIYPELSKPAVLARVEREMLNALRLSPWPGWVILYHDGRVEDRTFKDARNIQNVLLNDINGEIESVMSEVHYEILCDQIQMEKERQDRPYKGPDGAFGKTEMEPDEDSISDDEFDDVPFDD
jgi:hypothetical protein